jgi:diguanylate cyclase (GGDEF)-like protein
MGNFATVLVVEDHPDQRDLLTIVLQREGYRVLTADNGQEALGRLATDRVDLILTDIVMPHMDGFELVRRIRGESDLQSIYIIILTIRSLDADRVRGLDLGANDYVTKPFSFSELLARIRVGVRVASEHKRLREFKDQALRDALTGLNNRRVLEATAEDKFHRTQEGNIPLCLLIVDIDDFKKINDEYGHNTGDKVLRRIAKIVTRAANKGAICGRYGGEEFCLIGEIALDVAIGQAEKLRRMVERASFRTAKSKFSVTISIGISSTHLKKYSDWKQLFDDSDKAMYAAKVSGKNCVKVFLPNLLVTRAHSSS